MSNLQIGRAALEGTWDDNTEERKSTFKRASGMIDMMPQSDEEMEAIRNAVMMREGLLLSVFDVLRRIPRRVLMVLKLNDLTRSAISPSGRILSLTQMTLQEPRSRTVHYPFKCEFIVLHFLFD